jgi:hypothetical protein
MGSASIRRLIAIDIHTEDNPVAGYVASRQVDCSVEVWNMDTGHRLATKTWGYTWTNDNARWPQNANPPTECCVSDTFGHGRFTGAYGISGLPAN